MVDLSTLRPGDPCDHPGCLAHRSHPCEGCGRVGGLPDRRPILVGEANPYGGDPAFALYPEPDRSAGGRLCRLILKLEPRDYLRRYDRRNLCPEKWSMKVARPNAVEISKQAAPEGRVVVLFGSKVAEAFYETSPPFSISDRPFAGFGTFPVVTLPHPSGLCRVWNQPGAFERARAVLAKAGVV